MIENGHQSRCQVILCHSKDPYKKNEINRMSCQGLVAVAQMLVRFFGSEILTKIT